MGIEPLFLLTWFCSFLCLLHRVLPVSRDCSFNSQDVSYSCKAIEADHLRVLAYWPAGLWHACMVRYRYQVQTFLQGRAPSLLLFEIHAFPNCTRTHLTHAIVAPLLWCFEPNAPYTRTRATFTAIRPDRRWKGPLDLYRVSLTEYTEYTSTKGYIYRTYVHFLGIPVTMWLGHSRSCTFDDKGFTWRRKASPSYLKLEKYNDEARSDDIDR